MRFSDAPEYPNGVKKNMPIVKKICFMYLGIECNHMTRAVDDYSVSGGISEELPSVAKLQCLGSLCLSGV